MLGSRGHRLPMVAGAILLLAAGCADHPSYTWNPRDALPETVADEDDDHATPDKCGLVWVKDEPYVKRVLTQSVPTQVSGGDEIRVNAYLVGLPRLYDSCDPDSLVAVPEVSTQQVSPHLDWTAMSGLTIQTTPVTTWSVLATVAQPLSGAVLSLTPEERKSPPPPPPLPKFFREGIVVDVVRFEPLAGATGDDALEAAFTQKDMANVATIDGQAASGDCVNDRVVSFTGAAKVGTFDGACSSGGSTTSDVVLYPGRGPVLRHAVSWSDQDDLVDFGKTPLADIVIPVKLWWFNSDTLTSERWDFVKESIKLADSLLVRHRAGLRVKLVETAVHTGTIDCGSLPPATAMVNVYAIGDIGGPNGLSCRKPNGVILLSGPGAGSMTFAHELGHTFSLRIWDAPLAKDGFPWTGHVDGNPDLGGWNVMFSSPSDDVPQTRFGLSLGQVYRMNFDERSWVWNVSPASLADRRQPVECQNKADVDNPCPLLHLDLAPLYPTDAGGSGT